MFDIGERRDCLRREICSKERVFSKRNMKKILSVLSAAAVSLLSVCASAQTAGDVFTPIAKYIENGDAESLSAWFSDNLEVAIFAKTNDASRNQAKQIMKSFFKTYTPRSFRLSHKAGRPNMKYALGVLSAGGEMFQVTIFVGLKDSEYRIQQLKIERID
jgi:hypothetical protein